jgi:hypothetical protein
MPRREILTSSQRTQLLAFSDDEGELIRRYTLTEADLAFVRPHWGDHNRLGIVVHLCSLRFPGRVLGENESIRDSNAPLKSDKPRGKWTPKSTVYDR